jgi:hypothetical protein
MRGLETQPPFSRVDGGDNVTSPHEFHRQRESRFAARYLTKLAHPAFIGQALEQLSQPLAGEEDDEEHKELLALLRGELSRSFQEATPDPLELLFQNAYSRVQSPEQMIALHALQKLHGAARYRNERNELIHVRNLVLAILNRPLPPSGPQPVA